LFIINCRSNKGLGGFCFAHKLRGKMSGHTTLGTILIIDDETKLRTLLARILTLEGYKVLEAGDARSAWKILERDEVPLILCDVKLPDAHGVELVGQLRRKYPNTEVILLTAYGNIPDGVQAMRNGAFDYLVKGDDNEKIIPVVARAMSQTKQPAWGAILPNESAFDLIIGQAPVLQSAIKLAKKVAPTDSTVLLTGETGTGKEVFAQAIHQASSRRTKPLVAINCSTFGREILESELFGHRAGAFTGAAKDKKGLLEEADGSTLFMDEIGEMPPELQAKLLRVLETREFLKVGDTKPTRVNVRFIAATNRDLLAEGNHFRQDLYYRLSVFEIRVPALGDVALLAHYFMDKFAAQNSHPPIVMEPAFVEKLLAYPWPGNVRELRNVLERAMILAEGEQLTVDTLPYGLQLAQANGPKTEDALTMQQVEKAHIHKVLAFAQGNKAEAARLLNIGLTTLYRKLEEYGLGHKD
jgi:two-component system, NtrC family, response regulator